MFICEVWLFDWYFPQFCKSDMSKYGYLEVFQRVPSTSRYRESTVFLMLALFCRYIDLIAFFSSFSRFRTKILRSVRLFVTRPRVYKTFSMLNSTEHEIFPAHKC